MKVWIMYEERGEYSDYALGILGVYSSAQQAQQVLAAHRERDIAEHPEKARLEQWTEWEEDEDGAFYCRKDTTRSWDHSEWTIEPYEMDEPSGWMEAEKEKA